MLDWVFNFSFSVIEISNEIQLNEINSKIKWFKT